MPAIVVRALGGETRGLDRREARLLVQVRMIGRDAESRDVHRIGSELLGPVGVHEDHGRGPVGLRAAVEQVQGLSIPEATRARRRR